MGRMKQKPLTARQLKAAVVEHDRLFDAQQHAHKAAMQSENTKLYKRADAAAVRFREYSDTMPPEVVKFLIARDGRPSAIGA